MTTVTIPRAVVKPPQARSAARPQLKQTAQRLAADAALASVGTGSQPARSDPWLDTYEFKLRW